MKIKAKITYKDGNPWLDEAGWQIVEDNKIGFCAVGDVYQQQHKSYIEAIVDTPFEIIERIKAGVWAIEYDSEGNAIKEGVDWLEDIPEEVDQAFYEASLS
jgi:hypothetical protein